MARLIDADEVLNLRDAAHYMKITSAWLYQLIDKGRVAVIEVAGYKMIERNEADRWLREESKQATKKNTTPAGIAA